MFVYRLKEENESILCKMNFLKYSKSSMLWIDSATLSTVKWMKPI